VTGHGVTRLNVNTTLDTRRSSIKHERSHLNGSRLNIIHDIVGSGALSVSEGPLAAASVLPEFLQSLTTN
jgi:hypothetical protein